MVPDLVVGTIGNYIVVEVGFTQADKIRNYQKDSNIKEIRWYTKDCELIAQWIKNGENWNQENNEKQEKSAIINRLQNMINNQNKVMAEQKYQLDKIKKRIKEKRNEIDQLNQKLLHPGISSNGQICSFCNKNSQEIRQLVAGPRGIYICDECIDLCHEIVYPN